MTSLVAKFMASLALAAMLQQIDAETRIVNYLRANVKPGQPVKVTELVNNVFKTPEERKALDRLFNTFFKVPITVAQLYTKTNKIPTLQQLSDQFGFKVPGEMDVILRVMESDPRIPRFMTRDPRTGEITKVDVAAVRADPNFGQLLDRSVVGLEGKPAPQFVMQSLSGQTVTSMQVAGQPHLIYFWFTNCPPCVQTTPILVKLYNRYSTQGFRIVAANADRVLELPYADSVRADYVKAQGIKFTTGHMSPAMGQSYGGVTLYPTMFFVNRRGQIVKQFVSGQTEATLEAAIKDILK